MLLKAGLLRVPKILVLLFAFFCCFCFVAVVFSVLVQNLHPTEIGDMYFRFHYNFTSSSLHRPPPHPMNEDTHILRSKRFTFDVFLGLISWVFAPLNWHWGSLLKPLLLLCWLFYFEERNHRWQVFSSAQCTALQSPSDFQKHQSFDLHSECPLRFPENRQKPRFGNSRLHPSSGGRRTCRQFSVAWGL